MSFELDTFAALRAIGSHADLFVALRPDLAKVVPSLIEKKLKAVGADVGQLRAVRTALGGPLFDAAAEAIGGKKAISFLKKLDKHWPDLKGAREDQAVARLIAIASGEVSPSPPPVKTKPTKSPKPAQPSNVDLVRTLSTTAMGAKRKA